MHVPNTDPPSATSAELTEAAARPAATARQRLRHVALALAFALVATGCATDALPDDEPDTDEVAADTSNDDADADASTAGDDADNADNGSDEQADNADGVRLLEDVVVAGTLVELDAGLYTGDLLDGLVISVPAGVGVVGGDDRFANYFFESTTRDGAAFVLPITGVVPPDRVGSPVATEELETVLTEVPDDLSTYFDAIPQLEVLDSGQTDTYRWWDIQVRPDLGDVHTECGPPGMECISLFGEPTGAVTLNTMTGWLPRVVQSIAEPAILLWAAGQDGTVGPGHELALELAEGFAQTPPPYMASDLDGGNAYRTRFFEPELRVTIPAEHGEGSWEVFWDVPDRFGLMAQRPVADSPPEEVALLQIAAVPGETTVDEVVDAITDGLNVTVGTGQLGGVEVPVLTGDSFGYFRPFEVSLPNGGMLLATPDRAQLVHVIEGSSQVFVAVADFSLVDEDWSTARVTELLEMVEFP